MKYEDEWRKDGGRNVYDKMVQCMRTRNQNRKTFEVVFGFKFFSRAFSSCCHLVVLYEVGLT